MKRNIGINPKDSNIGDAREKSSTSCMPHRDKKFILFKSSLSSKRTFPHCGKFSNIDNSLKRCIYRNVYRGKNCRAPSFLHCALLLEYHPFKSIFHIEKLRERKGKICEAEMSYKTETFQEAEMSYHETEQEITSYYVILSSRRLTQTKHC